VPREKKVEKGDRTVGSNNYLAELERDCHFGARQKNERKGTPRPHTKHAHGTPNRQATGGQKKPTRVPGVVTRKNQPNLQRNIIRTTQANQKRHGPWGVN